MYVKEEHITVIKKAPTQPLDLEMYRSVTPRLDASGAETPVTGFVMEYILNKVFSSTGRLFSMSLLP